MVQELVIKHAREWLSTPYRHQAALKHFGCDCIGLVRGIWQEIYGAPPKNLTIPSYSPSWAEESNISQLVETCRLYMAEISVSDIVPGDIVIYRMLRTAPPKHCAVMVSPSTIIHAYQKHGVVETPFLNGRTITMTNAFRFLEEI